MTSDGNTRTKSERLSLTCNPCRSRHQKCNGARPLCDSCQLRGLSCGYPGALEDEQPAPRHKRVGYVQKSNALSNKRSKQRVLSLSDGQECYSVSQDVIASEMVRHVPKNHATGTNLTSHIGQKGYLFRGD